MKVGNDQQNRTEWPEINPNIGDPNKYSNISFEF